MPDEIFASKHRDSNSVATIEDRCYVLTYNEYCRYVFFGRMVLKSLICTKISFLRICVWVCFCLQIQKKTETA